MRKRPIGLLASPIREQIVMTDESDDIWKIPLPSKVTQKFNTVIQIEIGATGLALPFAELRDMLKK